MQTPHRKKSNPEPSCYEVTVLTTDPACTDALASNRLSHNKDITLSFKFIVILVSTKKFSLTLSKKRQLIFDKISATAGIFHKWRTLIFDAVLP